MNLKQRIDLSKLPIHIAIIMDGNGRWAKQHGKQRAMGHIQGVKTVREIVEAAAEIGIKHLTLYAFSTENWNRPKTEVNALMKLLVSSLNKEVKTLNKNNIRLKAIGDIDALGSSVQKYLLKAMNNTSQNDRMTLNIALSYSSQWEIINAIKKLATDVKDNIITPNEINTAIFEKYLNTIENNIPHPDLLIRTSGEFRISNFLLWQLAYSELYFTPVLWPDFNKDELYNAIIDYQNRERRYGKISEQIQNYNE